MNNLVKKLQMLVCLAAVICLTAAAGANDMRTHVFSSSIKSVKLSEGGITETSVDIRILMREAVLSGATIMAFVHNHPSGNTQPSKADDVLTQQIAKACQVMRIFFMDHVIVTDGAFYSYHDKGRL